MPFRLFGASVFILPAAVLDEIERILRQFLWKGPELGREVPKSPGKRYAFLKGREVLASEDCMSAIRRPCSSIFGI